MILLDLSGFLGRFHPVVVHLPIGFILLAVVFEVRNRKQHLQNRMVPFAWLMGGLSAILAAVFGWMLGNTESYDSTLLDVHRWLGIGVILTSFIGFRIKSKPDKYAKHVHDAINVIMVIILLGAGHYGGNLTHGTQYLVENAPPFVQSIFAFSPKSDTLPSYSNPDSTQMYHHLIAPILENKCNSCHNDETQRGGLNLSSMEAIKTGGDGGEIIYAGDPFESELFRRVTLPHSSEKYMPPKGEPLNYDEISLMQLWIREGSPDSLPISDLNLTEEDELLLLRMFNLDTKPKAWYETVRVSPLAPELFEVIENVGLSVNTLAENNHLLDIQSVHMDTITVGELQEIQDAFGHITWLSLPNQNLTDDVLSLIKQMPNLTKLRLDNNPITNEGLKNLESLEHLEVLNLYGTKITNDGLASIQKIPSLKTVYLWQTGVTAEGLEQAEIGDDIEVILGL